MPGGWDMMILGKWMMGLGLSFAIAFGSDAQANTMAEKQVMLHCAAQFDARTKWLNIMEDGPEQGVEMAMRRDVLLASIAKIKAAPDQHLRFGRHLPSFQERSLIQLTKLAEAGQVTSCPQDALCLACSELVPLR